MNKQFKNMKFWFNAGEVELYDTVCDLLVRQGCTLCPNIKPNKPDTHPEGISVESNGEVSAATCKKDDEWWCIFLKDYEEINIDWLRTQQPPETITLGGSTYIKSELEEALKNIKPIGGNNEKTNQIPL